MKMTIKEALLLRPGDTVILNLESDDGMFPTVHTIQAIEIRSDRVVIMDTDGEVFECDANELEYRKLK